MMVLVILVTTRSEEVSWPPLVPVLFSVTVGRVEIIPSTALDGVGVTEGLGVIRGVIFGVAVGVTIEPESS